MKLDINQIAIDAGTQSRTAIDESTVAEYAAAMEENAPFPPVVVYFDGTRYLLADGFHRVLASARVGYKNIDAEVRKGTIADALWCSIGANKSHGLRRTNADKRRCVEMALKAQPKASDRVIADHCGVGHPLVGEVRTGAGQLEESTSCAKRVGKDGKARKMPAARASASSGKHQGDKRPTRAAKATPSAPTGLPDTAKEALRSLAAVVVEMNRTGWPKGQAAEFCRQVANIVETVRE